MLLQAFNIYLRNGKALMVNTITSDHKTKPLGQTSIFLNYYLCTVTSYCYLMAPCIDVSTEILLNLMVLVFLTFWQPGTMGFWLIVTNSSVPVTAAAADATALGSFSSWKTHFWAAASEFLARKRPEGYTCALYHSWFQWSQWPWPCYCRLPSK